MCYTYRVKNQTPIKPGGFHMASLSHSIGKQFLFDSIQLEYVGSSKARAKVNSFGIKKNSIQKKIFQLRQTNMWKSFSSPNSLFGEDSGVITGLFVVSKCERQWVIFSIAQSFPAMV